MSINDVVPSSMGEPRAAWNDGLEFLRRQCRADSEKWFPETADDLPFMILAMLGEAGEVANIVKKIMRGSISDNDVYATSHLAEEIVDVLIYLCNIMGHSKFKDVNWMEVWYEKRKFNQERFETRRDARRRQLVEAPVPNLPAQVLAEAGKGPEVVQNWQTPGEFAS